MTDCPRCGEPIPPRTGRPGRPWVYCSDACRVTAHHRRVTERRREAARQRATERTTDE